MTTRHPPHPKDVLDAEADARTLPAVIGQDLPETSENQKARRTDSGAAVEAAAKRIRRALSRSAEAKTVARDPSANEATGAPKVDVIASSLLGGSEMIVEYENLMAMRTTLDKLKDVWDCVLVTEGQKAADKFEHALVSPLIDSLIEQEERVLDAPCETICDLALKVVVCAENDFSAPRLNDLLQEEARRLARRV